MKRLSPLCLVVALLSLPALAHAHPGHDGHELTWEFGNGHFHLDWLLGAGLAVGAIWGVYRFVKRQRRS